MIDAILRAIYAYKCMCCGKVLGICSEIDLCPRCYNKLEFLDDDEDSKKDKGSYYDSIIATFKYDGNIKGLIKKYKYNNKGYLFRPFARLMFEKAKDNLNGDIIIGVPLHRERENERGYNQANLLAKELSKLSNIPYGKNILKRINSTNRLALCNKRQRREIIQGAFLMNNSEKIKGKTVIIVDDVFTTGATIDECSRVLKQHGAKKVIGIVIAKTLI